MNENKGKVVVCYPIVQGDGCKYIATNIAHHYKAKNTDKKVALVDFDLKLPYLGSTLSTHDDIHGIDNLIDKIDGGFLSDDLFKENMIKLKSNVELLKGTNLIGNHKIFNKKHIENIIEHLRDLYDFIVIAVSPDPDNAGTVYGLHEADEVVMICKNNFSNYKSLDRAVGVVRQYSKTESALKLIFNMYNESSQIDFNAQINDHNIEIIGAIKYDENTMDNVDLSGSSFKVFKGKSKTLEIYEPIIETFNK